MSTTYFDPRDPHSGVAPSTACACLQPAPWVVVDDVRRVCYGLLERYRSDRSRFRDRTPEAVNHALDVLFVLSAAGGAR